AQLVEQLTLNQRVEGSNPSGGTSAKTAERTRCVPADGRQGGQTRLPDGRSDFASARDSALMGSLPPTEAPRCSRASYWPAPACSGRPRETTRSSSPASG